MAAEAVLKIKQTEDQGKEAVRNAGETAKQVIADAKRDGAERRKAILQEAAVQKKAIIQAAVEKAQKQCESIAQEGAGQREKLLSPDNKKLESAIQIVMERIVSVNGNC